MAIRLQPPRVPTTRPLSVGEMLSSRSMYDDAKEHMKGAFPESLPMEQAYLHIGMYLGWVIESGLYSEYFGEEASTNIFRFKRKEISCTVLSAVWNGYLAFEFLSKTGNNFTLFYYTSGLYKDDYEQVLGRGLPTIYHVDDTWPNYEKLKARINMRYREWYKLKTMLNEASAAGKGDQVAAALALPDDSPVQMNPRSNTLSVPLKS